MAIGKVKKPSPQTTVSACIGGIVEGKTQKQIYTELGISKPTLRTYLKMEGTSWKDLISKHGSETVREKKIEKAKEGKKRKIIQDVVDRNLPVIVPEVVQSEKTKKKKKNHSSKTPPPQKNLEVNEEFIEKIIISAALFAEQEQDPKLMIDTGRLALTLLDKKHGLTNTGGEEHEYEEADLKKILGEDF